MKILNATLGKAIIPIPNSRDLPIIIGPGEVSSSYLASDQLIRAVLSAGSETEFAIILEGGWEVDLSKTISGGIPYYYTSEDEARKRLIDPNIDYNPSKESDVVRMRFEKVLKEKEAELDEKINEIKSLKRELEESKKSFNDMDSVRTINEKESKINDLKSKVSILENQMEDLKNDMMLKEKENAEYRQKTGDNDQVIKNLTTIASGKDEEIKKLKKQNKDASKQLEELSAKTEQMKATFNKVCSDFGLKYDKDSDTWTQEKNEKESEGE